MTVSELLGSCRKTNVYDIKDTMYYHGHVEDRISEEGGINHRWHRPNEASGQQRNIYGEFVLTIPSEGADEEKDSYGMDLVRMTWNVRCKVFDQPSRVPLVALFVRASRKRIQSQRKSVKRARQ